jgi:hypothetical protein
MKYFPRTMSMPLMDVPEVPTLLELGTSVTVGTIFAEFYLCSVGIGRKVIR